MTVITRKSQICEINSEAFYLLLFFKIKIPANFAACLMERKSGDDNRFRFHHSKLLLIRIQIAAFCYDNFQNNEKKVLDSLSFSCSVYILACARKKNDNRLNAMRENSV